MAGRAGESAATEVRLGSTLEAGAIGATATVLFLAKERIGDESPKVATDVM
jgi:hypothetical protein